METHTFNASKHISFTTFPKTYKLGDLGYANDHGISNVAVSKPFPLFTRDAVEAMRREALAPGIQARYAFSSNLAPLQLRGYIPS